MKKSEWKEYYEKLNKRSKKNLRFLKLIQFYNNINNKKNFFIHNISDFYKYHDNNKIDYEDLVKKSEYDFIYFYRLYFDKKNPLHLEKYNQRMSIRKKIFKTTLFLIDFLQPDLAITNGGYYGENGSFYDACKKRN